MREYHVITAKKMGLDNADNLYTHFAFPVEEFTKEQVMAQFVQVTKYTDSGSGGRMHPYTAYEFNGETFYLVRYSGIANEEQLKNFEDNQKD
jgi:hypothetical protein